MMKPQHAWVYPIVCVFFLGSIIMGVLAFLGNHPSVPILHTLSFFSIESNNDEVYELSRYSVGNYGLCSYTGSSGDYELQSCSTEGRAPFYFKLGDVIEETSEYSALETYESTLANCMKAVWILLLVHIAVNVVGLAFAVVGIARSSLCREIAVHVGVLSSIINILYAAIGTAYGKAFVSKFNQHTGGVARARFGTGAVVIVWVLFGFSYLLFAFITVAIKRRNRDLEHAGKVEAIDIEVASEAKQQYTYHSSPQSTIENSNSSNSVRASPTRAPRVCVDRLASPLHVQPQQFSPQYRTQSPQVPMQHGFRQIPANAYYMPPQVQSTPPGRAGQQPPYSPIRYPSAQTLPQKYPYLR